MRTRTLFAAGIAAAVTTGSLAALSAPAQALTLMCAVPTWVTPIEGTPGDDVIHGTDGVDVIDGKGGNDIIFGKGGNDVIFGGDGNDLLYGAEGNDCLMGGNGQDTLRAGLGDDRLFGEAGDDELATGESATSVGDYVDGGDGTDTLIYDAAYFSYTNIEILVLGRGWYGQ